MTQGAPPYRRSGLDAVVDAVDRGPLWPPLAYALLAALLVAAVHVVAMLDGSLAWGTLSMPLVGFAVWPAYVLAAKAFVRATAARAVDDLCPSLTCDAAEVERLRYRLTTQPLGPSLAVGAAFVLVSLPSTVLDPHYVASTGLFTSPVATALHAAILLVSLWLTGAAGYGIVHVLRVIHDVYARHLRFEVLAPQNLFALANLAVRAALAVLGMQYVFVGANPEVIASRAVLTQLVAWQALAVVLFVVPLWSAHRRLVRAKARLGREVGVRFERTVRALHAALDEGRTADAADLKDALAGLETARAAVARASTWPWEAEAPRLLVSALLLPLVAWAVQQVAERWFG
jgi:hypothetical protein